MPATQTLTAKFAVFGDDDDGSLRRRVVSFRWRERPEWLEENDNCEERLSLGFVEEEGENALATTLVG